MICSISGPSTTRVMSDIFGSTVGPTAREWMLKPRLANIDETRARTPGLFSTRALMTWFTGAPRR